MAPRHYSTANFNREYSCNQSGMPRACRQKCDYIKSLHLPSCRKSAQTGRIRSARSTKKAPAGAIKQEPAVSNLRPSGYEPDELPDCSTPHQQVGNNIGSSRLFQEQINQILTYYRCHPDEFSIQLNFCPQVLLLSLIDLSAEDAEDADNWSVASSTRSWLKQRTILALIYWTPIGIWDIGK